LQIGLAGQFSHRWIQGKITQEQHRISGVCETSLNSYRCYCRDRWDDLEIDAFSFYLREKTITLKTRCCLASQFPAAGKGCPAGCGADKQPSRSPGPPSIQFLGVRTTGLRASEETRMQSHCVEGIYCKDLP